MSTRKRKRTPVQRALIELRKTLRLTQQEFSQALGAALVSVARWESSRPPSGLSLAQLEAFARDKGLQEIAATFRRRIEEEQRPQKFFKPLLHPDEEALRGLRFELHERGEEYLNADIEDWDEAEILLRRLRRLQSAYIAVLQTLRSGYDALLEDADDDNRRAWNAARADIDYQIREEQKKEWKQ